MAKHRTVTGKVRIAFIGAGYWAVTNHLKEMARRDDVELVSVCRLGRPELRALQTEYGFALATEDAEEALEAGIDAAVIASPNHLHSSHALSAIRRGIHVMVEKPLALTSAEAWTLIREADTRGLHLLVPHGWQYNTFVERARRLLQAGSIGRIRMLTCHMASPLLELFEGSEGYGATKVGRRALVPDADTWSDRRRGGGYAYGQMSHSLSLLMWLTELHATRVVPQVGLARSGVDIADAALVEFKGGAFGVVSGTGLVPKGSRYQVDIRLFGDDGMLLLDLDRARSELRRHDGQVAAEELAADDGLYACDGPPNRFVDLIRGLSSRNQSPGETAARALEIIEQLRQGVVGAAWTRSESTPSVASRAEG